MDEAFPEAPWLGKMGQTLGNVRKLWRKPWSYDHNYGISEKLGKNGETGETMTIQWLGSASELHVSILFSKIHGELRIESYELSFPTIDEQMMCLIFRSAKIEVY